VVTRPVNEVLDAYSAELMAVPGVTAVYVGALEDRKPCIVVCVEQKTSRIEQALPKALEGYPVLIKETGRFVSL